MSIVTTTADNVFAVLDNERRRQGPRDERGHFLSRECPRCGCGTLQFEGRGVWRCDGLKDPERADQELEACDYTHFDGSAPANE